MLTNKQTNRQNIRSICTRSNSIEWMHITAHFSSTKMVENCELQIMNLKRKPHLYLSSSNVIKTASLSNDNHCSWTKCLKMQIYSVIEIGFSCCTCSTNRITNNRDNNGFTSFTNKWFGTLKMASIFIGFIDSTHILRTQWMGKMVNGRTTPQKHKLWFFWGNFQLNVINGT